MKLFESRKELLFVIAATLLCYYFTLLWIFPLFFSPLYPHHVDFYHVYVWPTFFHSWIEILTTARCACNAGYLAVSNLASLNFHLYPLTMIIMTMANAVLTVAVARNMSGNNKLFLPVVPIYLVAIFAHPFFYSIYTYQFCFNLSFFFTLLVMFIWTRPRPPEDDASQDIKWLLPLTFLASFTYETHMVPMALFWAFQSVFSTGKRRKTAIIMLLASSAFSASSLLYTRSQGAYFMRGGPESPYYVNASPSSIITVWAYYAKAWVANWQNALLMAVGVLGAYAAGKKWKEALLLIVMSAATLAPVSLQPNHMFDSYYSWSAVPLSFAVILMFAPGGMSVIGGRIAKFLPTSRAVCVTLTVLILFITALSLRNYTKEHYPRMYWHVQMEDINRNILRSFPYIKQNLRPGQKVLVARLCFPFHPFKEKFLDGLIGKSLFIDWTILPAEKDSLIKKPGTDETDLTAYDHIFLYHNDGRLWKHYPHTAITEKDLTCQ